MSKILAIGAHYDDVELGVGGTLLKHVESGDEVHIAVTSSDEYRTGDCVLRLEEQLQALNLMGVSTKNLFLFKDTDNLFDIITMLDKVEADIIYTMFEFDTHQAHRRCSNIGKSVGRIVSTKVIFYNSGTSYDFIPNAFSEISFDFKQKLLECFASQIKVGSIAIDIVKRRESYWASTVMKGNKYVEGLLIKKMLYNV